MHSNVTCAACGGSGRRPFAPAEAETLRHLTSTWITTAELARRLRPVRVGMRALANRLAMLEGLGAAERRPGKGRGSEWRRVAVGDKRRAA